MSDGSLSQDEIDALLMGSNAFDGLDSPSPADGEGGLGVGEVDALGGLFKKVAGTLASTLSGIMGTNVSIGSPLVENISRDGLLTYLSDEIVEVKMDFNQGLSGGHVYLFSPDNAVKIAGPMIGQDNIELDGTAISAVAEVVSQLTGSELTFIGDTIGATIMTSSPESQKMAKGLLSLGGDFLLKITYPVEIEGQGPAEMTEVLEEQVASDLASRLGASSQGMAGGFDASAASPSPSPQPTAAMGMGGGMPGGAPMGSGMMGGMSGNQQPMMGGGMMPQQPMMGGMPGQQPMMGGMPGGQGMNPYGMTPQAPPNVQGVQFPEFGANISSSEQRNIGLLMDVSMELTVELGRTKWQIKDILGIGEGTIIELDKLAGEPVDILVNNNLIARGEVVVIDENFGVRVTEIVSNLDRVGES